ncbi:MAG: hypothetical protein GX146_06500 [Myxococcales bacterium]|nr:hypothetical protein [Myxococcales bacterium]
MTKKIKSPAKGAQPVKPKQDAEEEFTSKLGWKGHLLIWIPILFIIAAGILIRING